MPTPAGFASVSMQFTLVGMTRPAYITFGVDPSETDPQAVAGSINTASVGATSLMGIMDSSVTLTDIRVSLGTDGGEDIVGVLSSNTLGTSSKVTVPPNCALLVHKITARGGRRGRGRVFIPWCINDTNVDEAGIIDSPTLVGFQTNMNNWRIALSSNQVPMVLLHDPSKPGTATPTTPGAPNVVTQLVVDKLIGTQRRRLGR